MPNTLLGLSDTMKLLQVIGVFGSIVSVIWLVYDFGFASMTSLFASLLSYGAFMVKEDSNGQGGQAIVGGKDSKIKIQNEGTIEAGKGGNGAGGGDAIHVAEGVKINIINKGVIKGGDAGN
jgi:hypothetical protein